MENLDPGIAWMGYDHSRIVERVDGVPTGRVDPTGARVRFAHSLAFFAAAAHGPTPTAERAARAVRAMHHTIKGTRPDGAPYDADDHVRVHVPHRTARSEPTWIAERLGEVHLPGDRSVRLVALVD
jgi:uncharacterized protein (DUF2236 family)